MQLLITMSVTVNLSTNINGLTQQFTHTTVDSTIPYVKKETVLCVVYGLFTKETAVSEAVCLCTCSLFLQIRSKCKFW